LLFDDDGDVMRKPDLWPRACCVDASVCCQAFTSFYVGTGMVRGSDVMVLIIVSRCIRYHSRTRNSWYWYLPVYRRDPISSFFGLGMPDRTRVV
jgi:hypothetical protein